MLSSMKVRPQRKNPNKVVVTVDLDKNVSKGSHRCERRWSRLNRVLANQISAALQTECAADGEPGADHEFDEDAFSWPKGLKSNLNPIDPFLIAWLAPVSCCH